MNTLRKTIRTLAGTSVAIAFVGCSSVPENNDALTQARNTVQLASRSPLVTQYAPLQLDKAQNMLATAENVWEDEGKNEIKDVEHFAYLAERHAQIALEEAATGDVKTRIANMNDKRNQILLAARESEINRLKRDAEISKRDAAALRGLVEELEGRQTERGLILTLGEILFDLNETTLKPGGINAINRLAEFLKEHPERNILIEGHTDSLGDETYNLGLSEQRAAQVKSKLTEFGADPGNINTTGYGESFPVATNDNSAGRQQNRRVEIVIADQGETPEYRTGSL